MSRPASRPGRRSTADGRRHRNVSAIATVLAAAVLLARAFAAPARAAEPPAAPAAAPVPVPSSAPAPSPPPPVVFQGATAWPVEGPPVRRAVIIVRGTKIEALGEELPIPAGASVVDVTGKHIVPGLVCLDASGVGIGRPAGNFADSLDPYDLGLRLAIAAGITTVNLVDISFGGGFGDDPSPGTGTSSAVIKLTAGDLSSMLLKEPGLNYLSLPPRQLEVTAYRLRESFRKAKAHLEAVEDARKKKGQPPRPAPEIAPFVAILENERATVVSARTAAQVRDALALRRAFPFDMVVLEPEEGASLAAELAADRVPVLLKARGRDFSFDFRTPVVDRDGLIPVRLPAAFAAAGAPVALLPYRRGISLVGLAGRDLSAYLLEAAFAVRGGMDPARALEAVTLVPARILRLQDRIGSLAPGKDADLVILGGPPLEYRSRVERVYIDGKLTFDRATSGLFEPDGPPRPAPSEEGDPAREPERRA